MRVIVYNHLNARMYTTPYTRRTVDGFLDKASSTLTDTILPFVGKNTVGVATHYITHEQINGVVKSAVSAGLAYLGSSSVTEVVAAAVVGYIISEIVKRLGFTPENVSSLLVKLAKRLVEVYRESAPKLSPSYRGGDSALRRALDNFVKGTKVYDRNLQYV
jgi:hypothetical protein